MNEKQLLNAALGHALAARGLAEVMALRGVKTEGEAKEFKDALDDFIDTLRLSWLPEGAKAAFRLSLQEFVDRLPGASAPSRTAGSD